MVGEHRGTRHLVTPGASPALHGHIVDVDAHVMLDAASAADWVGPELAAWVEQFTTEVTPAIRAAARARSDADVWDVRGWLGLGAADPADRLVALDRMGVARQLVFPPVTLPALLDGDADARQALHRYNDAALDWATGGAGRLFPVLQLPAGDVDTIVDAVRRGAARGAGAAELAFANPPGGRSPADPALDRLWAALADAGVSLVLHVGGGGPGGALLPHRPFLDPAWGASPSLRQADLGLLAGPFDLATIHLPAQVFLTALVLGGVLSRHPALTVGVLEMGAAWVPSWIASLDQAATGFRRFGLPLPTELPSDAVRRQVRVSPFNAEPIADYFAWPGLGDMLAFSTDYPHAEGGRDPVNRIATTLEPLGEDAATRFFVANGSRLFGR